LAATICAAVLALAGLWAASAVMTPVAFALFIIALVWPLQRRLQAVLPQVVAVLVTAAVALLAIGGGGWLVVWGFGGIAQWVIANAARLQGLYMHAADMLEQRGLYAAELFAEQVNVLWLVQVLRAIGGSLQGVLSFSIVTFVFVILGLLEVEPLGRRLRRMDDGQGGGTTIEAATEIAARLQTYMLVRFGMSVLTGLGFWSSLPSTGSNFNANGACSPSSSTSYLLSARSLRPCCPRCSQPHSSNHSTPLSSCLSA
jgi:AI-2 transport protein TqsA